MILIKNTEFDPSKIQFGDVRTMANGIMKFVPLCYGESRDTNLMIQTPLNMRLPFGVSSFDNKLSLQLEFNMDDPEQAEFHRKMVEVDRMVLEAAVEKSADWFGGQKSRDVVQDKHVSIVKKDPRQRFPDSLKLKFRDNNGRSAMNVFNERQQPVGMEYLGRDCRVGCLVELNSVFISSGFFSSSLKIGQVFVTSKPPSLDTFAFLGDTAA